MVTAPQLITGLPGAQILSPGYVVISQGEVAGAGEGTPPRPADVVLPDGLLVPGFVDLQVNGYYGQELMAARPEGWAEIVRRLPETGTTAFLPTFITAPLDRLADAFRATAAFAPDLPAGARVLGIHLEGPFIAPSRRGAHNQAWIVDPTHEAIDQLLTAGGGLLRLVTLAPERPGALAAITQLTTAGVLVSVGHSDATAVQVAEAADRGARMVTHLFDAQRPLHHREPGVVGQALADPRLTSGLIADLHHVAGLACRIAFAAAPGRIAIVTDAAACAGMPDGRYLLGGESIDLPPGAGQPPVRADGTLAGSALRMDTGVANMVAAGVDLAAAVAAATRVPADLIGCPSLGRIAPGAAGDLVWLGPDLQARATWIGGRRVFGGCSAGARPEQRQRWRAAVSVATSDGQTVSHMGREIAEQPAALRATIDALLPRRAEAARLATQTREVLFIGRGTSDNAAVYGTYLIQAFAGRLATLASPSIATTYRSRIDLSGVLAVALSQSGRTEEIVETLTWARDCGAHTMAITNGADSPLVEQAEVAFVTQAGTERAVPATKTFTTQLAALAVLALGLGADLDPGELRDVPDAVEAMLDLPPDFDSIVTELASVPGVVVSGRGLAYSAALELALKLKEACYLHAMGLSYADLLHGPIAVVDAQTPAIVLAARSGPTLAGSVELARRVTGAGAMAYGIGGGDQLAAACSRSLPGPDLPEWLAPIGLIVPGQLLTEALSRRLGLDPDSPRGLSKVTQTG